MSPGVDVAIPSYNYRRYLGDCVSSALGQDGADIRVLIVDNASTDGSAELAAELARRDPRIEIRLRDRNLGAHASFNEAVDWARRDYFLILCADDLLPPGAVARAVGVMEAHRDVNLVYGRTRFVGVGDAPPDDDGAQDAAAKIMSGPDFLSRFVETGRSPVGGPMAVVRTSAQKRAGHYDTRLAHTDDVEMWMRFACLGAVAEVDAVQLHARIHAENRSSVVSDVHRWNLEMEKAFDIFFAGVGASLARAGPLHRAARHSLADRAYLCALSHLGRREPGVLELARFALRTKPSLALVPPLATLLGRGDAMARMRGILLGR